MIPDLPGWIELTFLATSIITLLFFYFANGKPKLLMVLLVGWCILQSALAYTGFYHNMDAIPPRFILVLLPSVLLIIYGLLPKQIDWVMANRNLKISTFLHSIRIPVEIVLLYLFLNKMVPELMTFEGRNFDILAGITSLIIGFLFLKQKLSKKILLGWNLLGLCLVCFILFNGLLSARLPIQQFGFEQPNRAVEFFPFILLPAVVVPIVIYTHLTDIIKLRRDLNSETKN